MTTNLPTSMSNRALIDATIRAAGDERCATVELLALLGELDTRKLYLGEGCASLFAYCTQVLHLSEHAAYHRIEAARAARRFPSVLNLLANGALTLTTVAMLRPHLTDENCDRLVVAARHKSKCEVEQLIAGIAPKPVVATMIRRIPEPKADVIDLLTSQHSDASTGSTPGTKPVPAAMPTPEPVTALKPGPRPVVSPLTSDRFLVRVTLSAGAHANLRRAQDLLRHTIPTGDAAAVLERALQLLVDKLEHVKAAKTSKPRSATALPRISRSSDGGAATTSRHIPAQVRRVVWTRDQGRCAYIGPHGRCTETGRPEFHHLVPFARGGPGEASNIALRCRAHNCFESEAIFGGWNKAPAELGPDRV